MMDDLISRQAAIDACLKGKTDGLPATNVACDCCAERIRVLPSVQPEEVARDIATIIENEKDMRVILKNAQQMWIPVTEALPEKPFGCLVTVMDTEPMTMEEFENILPYFVGYDGEQWNDWEGHQCPLEVLAWMPIPEPWREGQDGTT